MSSELPENDERLTAAASPMRTPDTARNKTSVAYGSSSLADSAWICSRVRTVRITFLPPVIRGSRMPSHGLDEIHPQFFAQPNVRLSTTRILRRVLLLKFT